MPATQSTPKSRFSKRPKFPRPSTLRRPGFSELRLFSPQHFKEQLPYEGGWEALAALPKLERIEMSLNEDENGAALKRLMEAKPGLEVDGKLTRSRNYDGL